MSRKRDEKNTERPHITQRWEASDELGKLIRVTRLAAGLTQLEMAARFTEVWQNRFNAGKKIWSDRWIGRIESKAGSRPWLTFEQIDCLAVALECDIFQSTQLFLAAGHLSVAEILMGILRVTLPARDAYYGKILCEAREHATSGNLDQKSAQAAFAHAQAPFIADLAVTLTEINRAITAWIEIHPARDTREVETAPIPTYDHP